ncbi:uncharacterized protein [Haliotis asinina]|uniref:uncharacterized protein n=1 Tax=Haliotis asinina TaxID=109174 RepID=UPI0035323208
MLPAVLGLLLGCLAMTSAQVAEEEYSVLCRDNYGDSWMYVVPGSGCKKFINCYNQDYRGTLQCPEKTLFSENSQLCEDEDKVFCQEPFNQTPDCVTGVDPYNCSAFTYCHLGTEYKFSCNQGLFYSESKLICMFPEDLTDDDRYLCGA